MQKYESVSKLSFSEFKRLTGVQKTTFIEMIAIVKEAENKRTNRRGKPPHLSIEDKLLRTAKFGGFEIFKELLILDIRESKSCKAQVYYLKNDLEGSLSQKMKDE